PIEYGCLPRSRCPHPLEGRHLPGAPNRSHPTGGSGVAVPDADEQNVVGRGRKTRDPRDVPDEEAVPFHLGRRADDHVSRIGTDLADVKGKLLPPGSGKAIDRLAAPLALPDRDAMHAVVPAELAAGSVHQTARARREPLRRRPPIDEAGGVAVRDEADVLALRLVRDRQPGAPRQLARL